MNDRTNDSVPLAVRGFLLSLVACLHVAGAAALSHLSEPLRHDEGPSILRASWIEGSRPASLPSPPPIVQPTRQLPVVRPAPRPRPAVAAAIQSTLAPATVEAVPVDHDSTLVPDIDISATVAGGMVIGNGEDGEGGGDYVAPDFSAGYFSNPEPEYPPQSRRLREQGLVKLRVHVTVQGRADEVTLYKSSGYKRLDTAAINAVWRWQFRPAQRAGAPVAAWVVVPIRFELQG